MTPRSPDPALPDLALAGDLSVRVLDDLGPHGGAWSAVVEATDGAGPFVDRWWVDRAAPGRARFVVVFDGDRLLGGLALEVRRWLGSNRFQVLGEGVAAPDHADVVVAPGDRTAVAAALRQWFASVPFVLDAVGLRPESALGRVVGGGTALPWSSAPFLPLDPDTAPRPTSSRVANTVKRTRKRLVRDEAFETRVVGREPAEIERALDDLLRLHRVRWPDGSNFARTFDALRPVLAAGALDGVVGLHEGVAGDRVVASMVVFDHLGRRSYYQSGREMSRDWRGVGTVLMADVVADAHARGMTEFDFLRGRESYKLDWTDRERPLVRLIAANGTRERALAAALVTTAKAKPVVKRGRDRLLALVESVRDRRRPVR